LGAQQTRGVVHPIHPRGGHRSVQVVFPIPRFSVFFWRPSRWVKLGGICGQMHRHQDLLGNGFAACDDSTPKYRTVCLLGGGTRAASRAIRASGGSSTDDVPSDHGRLSSTRTFPSSRMLSRSLASGGRRMYRQVRRLESDDHREVKGGPSSGMSPASGRKRGWGCAMNARLFATSRGVRSRRV
jgi:hypothetical protein